jgi:uncharacterized protein involved in exopolysaccharide biosynthesis/pSer/pThr/pTyr-binding forkhead associated (FHA) protein
MNAKPTRPHVPFLTLGDIYYILFRHKWKILVLSAAGIIAAIILPLAYPKVYLSEAKLLVKYVTETRQPGPSGDNQHTIDPDANGRNVINTELQILTSMDLDLEVATNVTAAKILGHEGSVVMAASVLHNNLTVEAPFNSDVINITFKNRDSTVVQTVLGQVIKTYLEHHRVIHLPGGQDDVLTQETDSLKGQLNSTEAALRTIKTNLNIVSFDDSRKMLEDQMMKIQQDIYDSEAELAQDQAIVDLLNKQGKGQPTNFMGAQTPPPIASSLTNNVAQASSSNSVAQQGSTNGLKMDGTDLVPAEKLTEYKRVCEMLENFGAKEKLLLMTYLPENSVVKDIHQQITDLHQEKKQLETEWPALTTNPAIADAKAGAAAVAASQYDWMTETTRIAALQKKIEILTNQLGAVRGRITLLDGSADQITQLERTRKIEAQNFEQYQTSLENTRIALAFGSGKASNIDIIQNPSAPALDSSKTTKLVAALAVVGIVIGLALAFVIELYFDHSLKRPADVESRMGVPLFLSIPYRNGKSKMRLLKEPPKTVLVLCSESNGRTFILNGGKTTVGRDKDSAVPIEDDTVSQHHCEIMSRNGEVIVKDLGSANGTFVNGERIVEATLKPDQRLRIGNVEFVVQNQEMIKDLAATPKTTSVTPPWDPRHALRPFYDTLRDRLITYFEVKNLTHNPKLVALTSCSDRAGVSSTAAGLAAALSETGEGNVLLVDMNVERGAAHHFYKGHLSCGIDEALTKDKRQQARVQDNLYIVTESSNEELLPRVLPKRFNSLVSKLKASDFDYIIFDMPPMSQISITPRLAKFMDMVMVVVESEKTDRDVVQRAVNMLTETKANVSVVLNKRKNYVPRRLQQEL